MPAIDLCLTMTTSLLSADLFVLWLRTYKKYVENQSLLPLIIVNTGLVDGIANVLLSFFPIFPKVISFLIEYLWIICFGAGILDYCLLFLLSVLT